MTETMVSSVASLRGSFRPDLPGRFNELDVLRREWPLFAASLAGQVLPPYEVLVHPSSGCNLRCQWCIGDHVPLEIWDSRREVLTVLEASKKAPERLPDVLADPAAMMKLARKLVDYRKASTYRSGGVERTAKFGIRTVSFSGLIGEPLIARAALVPAIGYLLARARDAGGVVYQRCAAGRRGHRCVGGRRICEPEYGRGHRRHLRPAEVS